MKIRDLVGLAEESSSVNLDETLQCRVLGIDLGTTNSTLAEICYDPENPQEPTVRCIPVDQPTAGRSHWNPLVPSVLAIHEGEEIIGEGARQLRERGHETGLIEQGSLFSCVKNDMGLKRTYHMAPSGYRSAAEISGRLLRYLHNAALKEKSQTPQRTAITVPASFQAAQREDTAKAAKLGGFDLKSGDLLDEPVAALISYMARYSEIDDAISEDPITMLVFDFGGGTCDVAIVDIAQGEEGERLTISPLAVSRYHRLGGVDIDQAIFYEVLLPQILEQNNISPFDLDFDCKKSILEPAFIGIAEQLKIRVCEKISRLKDTSTEVKQVLPEEFECVLPDGRRLLLENPSLTSEDLVKVLGPFLDPHALFARETEYRQTLSIFSPIIDAIERCELQPEDIAGCLLVGGSCLNPYISSAVEKWFDQSVILAFETADEMQLAVAEGAVINALSLTLTGLPVVQPVCAETISLVTQEGKLDLVPRGTKLPNSGDENFSQAIDLQIPQTEETETVSVRVEVVAGDKGDSRRLISEVWNVPAPREESENVSLEYSYDQNQVLQLRLSHSQRDDVPPFIGVREHPLTHVVNPQRVKLRIDATEEKLRTGEIPAGQRREAILRLAEDCSELRQYEKALARLAEYQRVRNEPDTLMLNRMGLYAGYMGDKENEEKYYRLCIEIEPDGSAPWFNLALMKQKQGLYDEAIEATKQAIENDPDCAPYLVLKAEIQNDMGKEFASKEFLKVAAKKFPEMEEQSSWELHWYGVMARLQGDKDLQKKIALARKEHSSSQDTPHLPPQAIFPMLSHGGA